VGQRNTRETSIATTVLLVGGPQTLVESVKHAARCVPTAELVCCELGDAATRVAQLWPFAIVMSDDLYTFDAPEFEALARDVQARLITVTIDGAVSMPAQQELGEKILEAFRWRMSE
jgi:hypothetical protein